jgi:hypothetical protein
MLSPAVKLGRARAARGPLLSQAVALEIERVVREGKVEGTELKLRMTLTAENAPLNHIVEETIDIR